MKADGSYIKTACVVRKVLKYSEADELCRVNGMELYTTSSPEEKRAVKNYAKEVWPEKGTLWLNSGSGCTAIQCLSHANTYEETTLDCNAGYHHFCEYKVSHNGQPNTDSSLIQQQIDGLTSEKKQLGKLLENAQNLHATCIASTEELRNSYKLKVKEVGDLNVNLLQKEEEIKDLKRKVSILSGI